MRVQNVSRFVGGGILALGALTSVPAVAAPPNLGLDVLAPDRIIRGATVPVLADVFNVAAAGADALNYSLYYTLPDATTTPVVNGVRAADGGAGATRWQYDFNSAASPFGANNFSVTVAGQTGTLNSPQTKGLAIQVLNHVEPAMWINGVEIPIRKGVAQEPSVDPLAFGATGGGESFAASAPHILGDPLVPTAAMDLDTINLSGDPAISSTLIPTPNVPPNDSPSAGIPWTINIQNVPGHHEAMLTLGLSDEDIPGAVSSGSILAELLIKVDVNANGQATGTLTVLPEPTGAATLLLGALAASLRRRRPAKR
jgi:hypothetical protein